MLIALVACDRGKDQEPEYLDNEESLSQSQKEENLEAKRKAEEFDIVIRENQRLAEEKAITAGDNLAVRRGNIIFMDFITTMVRMIVNRPMAMANLKMSTSLVIGMGIKAAQVYNNSKYRFTGDRSEGT